MKYVQEFCYINSTITKDAGEKEIIKRIFQANSVFHCKTIFLLPVKSALVLEEIYLKIYPHICGV